MTPTELEPEPVLQYFCDLPGCVYRLIRKAKKTGTARYRRDHTNNPVLRWNLLHSANEPAELPARILLETLK